MGKVNFQRKIMVWKGEEVAKRLIENDYLKIIKEVVEFNKNIGKCLGTNEPEIEEEKFREYYN